MDYFGLSSPTFSKIKFDKRNKREQMRDEFENFDPIFIEELKKREQHEQIRDQFQSSNPTFIEDLKNNFEKSQKFYSNQNDNNFSMKKRDTIINGFRCQNVYCSNREAIFGTIYLPFCNENRKCMKKNIQYLLLENAKLKGQIEEQIGQLQQNDVISLAPMDIDFKDNSQMKFFKESF